jgi:hypothetical protein
MNLSFVLTVLVLLVVAGFVVQSICIVVEEYFKARDPDVRNLQMPGNPDRF